MDASHPLLFRGEPACLQAGQPEADDRGIDSAQGSDLLNSHAEHDSSNAAGRAPGRFPAGPHPHGGSADVFVGRGAPMTKRVFQIYRYDPDTDAKPRMQTLEVELDGSERMLLDALNKLKAVDPTLSFRRSCREGVCGSDAMNINGKNGLACLTNMRTLKDPIVLKPLPGLPVIRDLIVDMTQFFKQYNSIKPYLVNDEPPPEKERLQSPEEREELDGLYECILCAS